jgi:hypothetical protein
MISDPNLRLELDLRARDLLSLAEKMGKRRGRGSAIQQQALRLSAIQLLIDAKVPRGITMLFSNLLGSTSQKRRTTVLAKAWHDGKHIDAIQAALRAEPAPLSVVVSAFAAALGKPGSDCRKQVMALRRSDWYQAEIKLRQIDR